jgi:hypothetical protein
LLEATFTELLEAAFALRVLLEAAFTGLLEAAFTGLLAAAAFGLGELGTADMSFFAASFALARASSVAFFTALFTGAFKEAAGALFISLL